MACTNGVNPTDSNSSRSDRATARSSATAVSGGGSMSTTIRSGRSSCSTVDSQMDPAGPGTATRSIAWNTGQTSTFTYNRTVTSVGVTRWSH